MHPDKIFLTVNGRTRSLSWLIENAANATDVWVENNPGLTALPELPNANYVRVINNPGLTALPELPNANYVWVENNPGLTALPELPNANYVWVENNPGLTALPWLAPGGKDSRGYEANGIKIRGEWRIIGGCRNFTIDQARKHWRNNPEALAIVEKIVSGISECEAKENAA
jgi:hypothetical protein